MDEAAGDPSRYIFTERLSWTEHAAVYRAVDRALVRHVAVKVQVDDQGFEEARAIARARHPNVVEVYDVGVYDGQFYMVLEWCEGTTLWEWSHDRTWDEIIDRILEAGAGLQQCHALGIIHGDIKPANILVTEGRAVLADFGLATSPGEDKLVSGTRGYVAPELSVGLRLPANDVFALACTTWVCMFRELPFKGKTIEETWVRMIHKAPPPPKFEAITGSFLRILGTGMHPHPDLRPDLETWMRELDAERRRENKVRKAALTFVQVAAVVMVVAAVVVLGTRGEESVSVAEPARPEPVVVEPVEVVETVVTVQDVMEVARRGPALDAWEVYVQSRKTTIWHAADQMTLATTFLDYADRAAPGERESAATMSKRLLLEARHHQTELSPAELLQLRDIAERANQFIQYRKPSHQD